jgi:uncharacterized membrane protein YccC
VAELAQEQASAPLVLSFLRPGRSLSERVAILLATAEPAPASSRMRDLLRVFLALLVFSAVLRAALLGNP